MNICPALLGLLFLANFPVQGSRVLELSDKFSEVRKDGTNWLVMFYAPWCGHCKNLEPVWNQVANTFYRTPIYVGKVDCTRFPSVANEFKVKGFPTVMFIKGQQTFSYNGDRTKDALVNFALRMSQPAVQEIRSSEMYQSTLKIQNLFFLYVGAQEGILWESYNATAHEFQSQAYFYSSNCPSKVDKESFRNLPAVYVHKDGTVLEFSEPIIEEVGDELYLEDSQLHKSLRKWVNRERFLLMSKVTHGNFHQTLRTDKFIVLAVLEEKSSGNLPENMAKYKKMLEDFARKNQDRYHNDFLFGWTASTELPSSFALTSLPSPSLVVVNSTTLHYHLPEDNTEELSEEFLENFFQQILEGKSYAYGGTGFGTRLYRVFYDASTSVGSMWQGNPILTIVLFGLPVGFLSLICYSICCTEFAEEENAPSAEEEEDEEDKGADIHEKED